MATTWQRSKLSSVVTLPSSPMTCPSSPQTALFSERDTDNMLTSDTNTSPPPSDCLGPDVYKQDASTTLSALDHPAVTVVQKTHHESLFINITEDIVVQIGRPSSQETVVETGTSMLVQLPTECKQASRIHAIISAKMDRVERVTLTLRVLGHNGLRVDGRFWKKGLQKTIIRQAGKDFAIDIWGQLIVFTSRAPPPRESTPVPSFVPTVIVTPTKKNSSTYLLSSPIAHSSAKRRRIGRGPSRSSSLTALDSSSEEEDEDDEESASESELEAVRWRLASDREEEDESDQPRQRSTKARILPPSTDNTPENKGPRNIMHPSPVYSDDSVLTLFTSPNDKAKSEPLALPPLSEQLVLATSQVKELIEERAFDLPSLIASAIAFQKVAAVDSGDIVEGILKEIGEAVWMSVDLTQSLEDDKRQMLFDAWEYIVRERLHEEVFFGCIENRGLKDVHGNPLQPKYYYIPDKDPNSSRVELLSACTRRMRSTRAVGNARYCWKKPRYD